MNADATRALGARLAVLLRFGTWLAASVIASGLVLPSGTRLVTAGIVLFIALPVVRVAVMLIAFLHHRDYRLGASAALVLLVVLLGIAINAHASAQERGMGEERALR